MGRKVSWLTGPPGALSRQNETKEDINEKKFYVWGAGPVQSALLREAEVSQEAIDAALAHGFVFDSPDYIPGDSWAVEVEATEEEIDEATRFDPAVVGYAVAEENKN